MNKQEFINTVIPVIIKVAKKNGFKFPSAIIAQAACESAWGGSSLAYIYNNYFGMKCGSSWRGKSVNMTTKEEYTTGTITTIKDNFRAYNTLEEGIQGYFDFIGSMSRYSNLKTANSPEQYIQFLKADGWATSSKYVNTLTTILTANNFKKYDTETVVQEKDKNKVIEAVKNLQTELNNYGGYGLAVDGIIGPKTTAAYNNFRGK